MSSTPAPQDPDQDLVDDATRRTEDEDGAVTAHADRPPTDEESRLAEESGRDLDPEVGEHYREMSEIGAEVQGEGEIG